MALTTAALPAGSESPIAALRRLPRASLYVRLSDPVVFTTAAESAAPPLPNVLPVPDTAGEADPPPPPTHSVGATIQGANYEAFFGDILLNQLVAIKGTVSQTADLALEAGTDDPDRRKRRDNTGTFFSGMWTRLSVPSGPRPCQYRMAFPLQ